MEKAIIIKLHKDFEQSVYEPQYHFPEIRKMVRFDHFAYARKMVNPNPRGHVKNNQGVRKLLIKRNIKPEELPAAEDIKKVERRLIVEQKKLNKAEPLDLTNEAAKGGEEKNY